MIINVGFDTSVSSAPAGFTTAVNYVVGLLEATFANNVTINLNFGWGEVDGDPLDSGAIGESNTALTGGYTFTQIATALDRQAASGNAVPTNGLPASDPSGGARFSLPTAEARALGLRAATTTVDGWVGLNSTANLVSFTPTSQAGAYGAIGILEHEITEIMGRTAGLSSGSYSALDLYRYSSSGVLDINGTTNDYFSVNHGQTNLDSFNFNSSGDYGDWASSAGADAFLAFGNRSQAAGLSSTDLTVMAALGWNDLPTPTVKHLFETPLTGGLAAGQTLTIALDFNTVVTVSGAPTLTLSDGGAAHYVSGSGGHGLVFQYAPSAALGAAPTPTALNLNGGTIASASGIAASLSLGGVTPAHVDNVISGAAGNTVLTGAGNDAFMIGGGNDTVTGGSGVNTAVFTGAIAQYYLTQTASALTVYDGLPARDGLSTLKNIQQVQFSDITLVFDLHSSQDLLVYELYQAAFARVPDLGGFRYWANVADTAQTPSLALADAFLAAPEFTQMYGANPTNAAFVRELYTNVLGRTPDSAGLTYWTDQANAGQPHDQLLVDFATSAENVQLIGPHTSTGYWTT